MKGTEKMKFTEFNLKPYIQEALKEINFREATEVQELVCDFTNTSYLPGLRFAKKLETCQSVPFNE